ncbi:DUF7133 domain-containing protein [Synoicihabitans lomoniglobus]|uniref:C-type cytochrome n=1 Tax=Synoicihabitans lomoniglobus TaxID=2909285 RepID=A0AAF0CS26_9BACT|nr:c-type cytochrome [Opitutaceae bacterium LMO-M01]WED67001.1 c-type cytochrome [Opitutaceae bacterium LMO-M01]
MFGGFSSKVRGALWFATATILTAQQGDRPGETQRDLPEDLAVPPAPVLTDAEALASIVVPAGYRVELVASHPLLHDPVAFEFGPDGRIWVVEMRGYMHDPEGAGEELPIGTVAVLDDTDGDGVMDQRVEFADGLVMPRALTLVADGVLVGAPPFLYHFKDTDGDDVADKRTVIADDYGMAGNPEHTANALYRSLDNWIYSANHNVRHRFSAGRWQRDYTLPRGQWGMDQDDLGRLYFNTNSDPLRVDLVRSSYFWRHPGLESTAPLAVQTATAEDVPTFPSRITPGINRGYRMLDDTWKLQTVTAACGPMIYRGARFGPAFQGNAFINEPSANLVKRVIVEPTADGSLTARNAYPDTEFVTSTDERFRPVNAYNGPDGAIYLLDFYRGIIQHRIFLTTYLRKQIEARGLDAPLGMGRIWKVVPETPAAGWVDPGRPALDVASDDELVTTLSHSNGWWRDTAQRLLVERGATRAIPALRKLVKHGSPLARQHALWTLEGLDALDRESVIAGLASPVIAQVAALQLSEAWLRIGDDAMLGAVIKLTAAKDPTVRRQAALSLGEAGGTQVLATLAALSQETDDTLGMADAIKSGLAGREVMFTSIWPTAPDNEVVAFVEETMETAAKRREPQKLSTANGSAKRVRPLAAHELARFEAGRAQFALCAGCHQPDGRGLPGLAPSLVASKLLDRDPRLVTRVILQGKEGWGSQMPGLGGALDDDAIAAVLTYVRRSFGHEADPVDPATVTAVRKAEMNRSRPWTADDLDAVELE